MINIDSLTEKIFKVVMSHKLENGAFSRYINLGKTDSENSQRFGINEYGCADAANILYTIGRFPTGEQRDSMLEALLSLQNPVTGMFTEVTHHPIHTTAHCIAAIELFDALPRYPLTELKKYHTPDGLYKLLDSLDWSGDPWNQSHIGAGVFAASVNAKEVGLEWQKAYFNWLWDNTDSKYGIGRKGAIDENKAPMPNHLFGWFHYSFNIEYGRQPMRFPEKVVDSCLYMYNNHILPDDFGKKLGFAEIDWVYCLNRASRQTPHRFDEARSALYKFALLYIQTVDSLNPSSDEAINDLHALFGAICAITELQSALPGLIESTIPWRLVLDRRPFI